jgi:hypothetical protein
MAELPFNAAVSVAVRGVDVDPAEALKVTELAPAGTRTVAGTVTSALLLESATVVPPEGAFPLMIAVQLAVAGAVKLEGVQLSELIVSSVIVMAPFDAVAAIACPVPFEAETPDSKTVAELVAEAEIWKLKVASTPEEIAVVFMPNTRQVIGLEPLVQSRDLAAPVAAAPALELSTLTLEGKLKVHSSAVGCAPLLNESDTGTETVAPGEPDTEPTLIATL